MANRTELYVGNIKEAIRKDLSQSNVRIELWDYKIEYYERININAPRPLFQHKGLVTYVATFVSRDHITNIIVLDWCKRF